MFPPDQLDALMAASDYVVMALPHTPATDKLVGWAALAALQPHAVLVNIGRGKTLDEDALVQGAPPASPFLGASAGACGAYALAEHQRLRWHFV